MQKFVFLAPRQGKLLQFKSVTTKKTLCIFKNNLGKGHIMGWSFKEKGYYDMSSVAWRKNKEKTVECKSRAKLRRLII